MTRATYIIYYTDKDGGGDGYEVYGIDQLRHAVKWLHSEEIQATDISIYKRGRDFDNNPDDVTEVHKQWWK